MFPPCLLSLPLKLHQVAPVAKNPPTNTGDAGDWFSPWVGKTPWRRKWQPTLVFLPRKSHGQRSLVGYIPWGCKAKSRT